MVFLTLIVPVYNEAQGVAAQVQALLAVLQAGDELIVVDGGSQDATWAQLQRVLQTQTQALMQAPMQAHVQTQTQCLETSRQPTLHLVQGPKGRAAQMNAGAALARNSLLWFIHADTQVPLAAVEALRGRCLATLQKNPQALERVWGRFAVSIEGCSAWLPVVAFCMNWRSRISRIATGDQGLFMHRAVFAAVGGFPLQPLMEDVELCKRLRGLGFGPSKFLPLRFWPISVRLKTSGRRWEQHGVWRTIVLMWRMRYAYWRGVPVEVLAAWYRDVR